MTKEQQPAAQPSTCQWWQEDEDSEVYQTSCGHFFNMASEPPHDWMKFCCYCGKAAKVHAWEPETEIDYGQ